MKRLIALPLLLSCAPVLAHPGAHQGMNLAELAGHLFETDHIIFALVAVAVGLLAYRAGRRAEARSRANASERRHDPR